MDVLALLMNKDDITHCQNAIAKNTDPHPDVLRRVLRSSTGAVLYRPQALKLQWSTLLLEIRNRIKHLEYNSYEIRELKSFKTLMARECHRSEENVEFAKVENKAIDICYLDDKYEKTDIENINKAWNLPLASCVKTVGLNNGQFDYYPWERAIYGDKVCVPGVPTENPVPD